MTEVSIANPTLNINTKKCPHCNTVKDVSEFYKNKARSDGLSSVCGDCVSEYRKRWLKTERGRVKHNSQGASWRANNRTRYLECSRRRESARRTRDISGKTIKCHACGAVGGVELFPPSHISKGGGYCRACRKDVTKKTFENYKAKPKDNFQKFTFNLYSTQIRSSAERKHDRPRYSLVEMRLWLLGNPLFNILMDQWRASGFDRKKKPTIDRINPFRPYSINNIQLITVSENNSKARHDVGTAYRLLAILYSKDENIRRIVDGKFGSHGN